MEKDKIIGQLKQQATAVATMRERYDAAGEAVKVASAELLEAVVDAVKPALKAICNRVDAAWSEDEQKATPATFRGFWMWGQTGKASIYLTDRGDLVGAKYSCYPSGDWTAEFDLLTSRQVVDVLGADLAKALDLIGLGLAAQAKGDAAKQTKAFDVRAERIRAAAILLRTA